MRLVPGGRPALSKLGLNWFASYSVLTIKLSKSGKVLAGK
jgi:hypothetical protein